MKAGLAAQQVFLFPNIETLPNQFDILTEDDFPIFHTIITYGIRPSEVRALKRYCIYGDLDQIVIKRTFTGNNKFFMVHENTIFTRQKSLVQIQYRKKCRAEKMLSNWGGCFKFVMNSCKVAWDKKGIGSPAAVSQ